MSEQIRVLVVDDDALVRAGLTMLLEGADDIEIVGEAADGSEVEPAVAEHQPDVVLMDIRRGVVNSSPTAVSHGSRSLAVPRARTRTPHPHPHPHPDLVAPAWRSPRR